MKQLSRNSEVEITIERLSYGGRGVGRFDGFVLFVPNCVPGDKLRVRVVKKKKNFGEASIVEILEPSPIRIKPPCPYFESCGGCTWQNVPYENQVLFKREIVKESIEHLTKLGEVEVGATIPAPHIWRYRNKMDFTFGFDRASRPALGFHRKGRFDQIVDISRCLIQPEPFDKVLEIVKEHTINRGITVYDPRRHEGFLRNLIIREGRTSGDLIVILLTGKGEFDGVEALVNALKDAVPNLKGFLWGYNLGIADVARMDKAAYTYGDMVFYETINGRTFKVSPFSFFQTNSETAAILYEKIEEFLELTGDQILLDAYCGTGSIGIYCAHAAKHVYGIESILESVFDARENAETNNLHNCTFMSGLVRKSLPLLLSSSRSDIQRIVVDPPRGGMHKRALRMLLEINAPVFVYVSCNPTTLARDIVEIAKADYVPKSIQPIDMFPHTYHIETVVKFIKRKTSVAMD